MNLRYYCLPLSAIVLTFAGCNSNSEHQSDEPVTAKRSIESRVVDYRTSDPRLEPTLKIGGYLEVRTTDGGPVVLQSQVDKQKRAAEQQRAENAAQQNAVPSVVAPAQEK